MQICFATHNRNKVEELRKLVPDSIEILSLDDLGISEEIEETGTTLIENAVLKAQYIANTYATACFADDTGLEVEAINGAPGVYSARFAGEPANNENNIDKLLELLSGTVNRRARFRTVIALIKEGKQHIFEGIVNGEITRERKGSKGFGYDAVFLPNSFACTFAEMNMEEKNLISHRGIAVKKLIDFLTQM